MVSDESVVDWIGAPSLSNRSTNNRIAPRALCPYQMLAHLYGDVFFDKSEQAPDMLLFMAADKYQVAQPRPRVG